MSLWRVCGSPFCDGVVSILFLSLGAGFSLVSVGGGLVSLFCLSVRCGFYLVSVCDGLVSLFCLSSRCGFYPLSVCDGLVSVLCLFVWLGFDSVSVCTVWFLSGGVVSLSYLCVMWFHLRICLFGVVSILSLISDGMVSSLQLSLGVRFLPRFYLWWRGFLSCLYLRFLFLHLSIV